MKTVFILGAGFSVDAGAPTQASLISKAIKLHQENPGNFDAQRFDSFQDFLVNQFNNPNDKIETLTLRTFLHRLIDA